MKFYTKALFVFCLISIYESVFSLKPALLKYTKKLLSISLNHQKSDFKILTFRKLNLIEIIKSSFY